MTQRGTESASDTNQSTSPTRHAAALVQPHQAIKKSRPTKRSTADLKQEGGAASPDNEESALFGAERASSPASATFGHNTEVVDLDSVLDLSHLQYTERTNMVKSTNPFQPAQLASGGDTVNSTADRV
jgi:hypothetical protein